VLKKIKGMWKRIWGFIWYPETISPPIINNSYYPVLYGYNKARTRIVWNGIEYEWWCHANTPWCGGEFLALGSGPNWEIYRRVNYVDLPVCTSCGSTDWECSGCALSLKESNCVKTKNL